MTRPTDEVEAPAASSRARAERDPDETESRFRMMADASPVLLWMAAPDGLRTFFNQTWLDFTGRTLEQEWGVGWAENVHHEDLERCMNTYVRTVNAREKLEIEYRLRRHDDEHRWILDRATPRYAPDGAFAGYSGSCVDITERHALEESMRSAVEARDAFLALASHELGTPLTALKLQVETLARALGRHAAEGMDTTVLEQRTRAISDQVLRLTTLVETLLDVSRLGEGRMSLSPESLDLSALVARVIARMSQVAVEAGCAIEVAVPGPVIGTWDRMRTEQVVGNLLSNAFKYGAGKPVRVIVSAADAVARVEIIDRGIGIPPDKHATIFERFRRVAPKTRYGGMGLGLWIARRALEQMGGAIRVRSEEGAGATFEIELPR